LRGGGVTAPEDDERRLNSPQGDFYIALGRLILLYRFLRLRRYQRPPAALVDAYCSISKTIFEIC
jgi:hypothetical protein